MSLFTPIFQAFASVLSFFYDLVPNYAVAIILLTLVVMLVVTPLTLKGTRSMMIMQQLQPEMKKIQTRYKDDRQKLNEELLKFYKENNINPLGGCLPLLVQMPIFIVLYEVLRGLTRRVSGLGYDIGWSSGQFGMGTSPGKAPAVVRPFDPAYLNHSSKMYENLNGNTVMASPPFSIDLAESCSQALQKGLWHATPFIILIVIVGITGFVQQKQIQGRNPNAQVNPQQQMIMKIMPVFLPVISFGLPAGLVLYFAVSNLYRIGQQAFISRSIYGVKKGADSNSKVIDTTAREAEAPAGLGGSLSKAWKELRQGPKSATDAKPAGKQDAKPQPATQASSGKTKASPRKTRPAGKQPTKTSGKASSSTDTKGNGRTTPSKRSAPDGRASDKGRRSGGGSSTKGKQTGRPSKPKGADSAGGTPGEGSPPTLQPRARKNKKR